MANPQKENGFTPIANEILESLVKAGLLGSEFQILLFILRKTYGYHKKKDRISLTQFEKSTGLSRPTIVKTLKNLVFRGMILKTVLPDKSVEYSFKKDYENWVVNTALLVKQNTFASKHGLTETSKHGLTHKRKKDNTKDNDFAKAKSLPSKTMKYYNEETGEYGEYKDLKKKRKAKEPRNKIALKLAHTFSDMCFDNLKVRPVQDIKTYMACLHAMKALEPLQIVDLMEEWFKSGKPKEDLIQITQALSTNQINRFIAK